MYTRETMHMSSNVNKIEYNLYNCLVTPQRKENFQKYFQTLIKTILPVPELSPTNNDTAKN